MRKAGIFIVAAFLLFCISKDSPATLSGKVIRVADGDTITLLIDNHQEKVRLEGVDYPEKGQAYGRKAKQFISDMVFGKMVSLKRLKKDR